MTWLRHILNRVRRRTTGVSSSAPAVTAPDRAVESADQRLSRLVDMALSGQALGAELELTQWKHEAGFPQSAAVLLAALMAQRGEAVAARRVLRPHWQRQSEHSPADAGLLLLSLLIGDRMSDLAHRVERSLLERHERDPLVTGWLAMLESVPGDFARRFDDAEVLDLAKDLRNRPNLLTTFVAAQKISPQQDDIRLLRMASALMVEQGPLEKHRSVLCQAMAELALLAGDFADARRWAHEGLRLTPYSAGLALVLAEVGDDPASTGPRAVEALEQAAGAYPTYPDVLSALVRRKLAEGRADEARTILRSWIDRDPASHHARRLEQELAA